MKSNNYTARLLFKVTMLIEYEQDQQTTSVINSVILGSIALVLIK